jgi:hypothetical protein
MVVRRKEKKGGGQVILLWKKKNEKEWSNRPTAKVIQGSNQWPGAPKDGQGAPVKKGAGISWKKPASRTTPASHVGCEKKG